jgi:hypothetical protein
VNAATADVDRQRRLRRRLRLRGPLAALTRGLELAEPAPVAEIVAAEKALRTRFPADYVQFLEASNGGRWQVGPAAVELWPVHLLRRLNEERGSELGLVVFATGPSGDEFAFRHGRFLRLPDRDKLAGPEPRGESFAEFLATLLPQ